MCTGSFSLVRMPLNTLICLATMPSLIRLCRNWICSMTVRHPDTMKNITFKIGLKLLTHWVPIATPTPSRHSNYTIERTLLEAWPATYHQKSRQTLACPSRCICDESSRIVFDSSGVSAVALSKALDQCHHTRISLRYLEAYAPSSLILKHEVKTPVHTATLANCVSRYYAARIFSEHFKSLTQ